MGTAKIKIILLFFVILIGSFLFAEKALAINKNKNEFFGSMDIHGNIHFEQQSNWTTQKILLGLETDRVKVTIIDSPQNIINYARAEINLSALSPNDRDLLLTKSYAIHSINSTTDSIQGSKAIFEAFDLGQEGVWTIEIIFPKGVLKPTVLQKIFYWSANNYLIWFIISCALILITILTIFILLWQRHRLEAVKKSDEMISSPPSDLSPAALAILEEKLASPRAVAAGILYLAVRGYIVIAKKNEQFLVSKRKEPRGLAATDRSFYDLLIGRWFAKSVNEINIESNKQLFNQSAGELHRTIYQELINRKLFVGDPWRVVHVTKFIGILLMTSSIIAFLISLKILPYPPYASIIWLALSFISFLIYKISTKMPLRSPAGKIEREAWYRFKKYLSFRQSAALTVDLPMDFYLPFAIALKCELAWIRRFASTCYHVPSWYVGPSVTLEDVASDLINFVDQFSQIIDANIAPDEI